MVGYSSWGRKGSDTTEQLHSMLIEVSALQVILARQYGSEGRFTFTSHTPGEHQICLHSNSTKFSLFAGGMLVSGPMLDSFNL